MMVPMLPLDFLNPVSCGDAYDRGVTVVQRRLESRAIAAGCTTFKVFNVFDRLVDGATAAGYRMRPGPDSQRRGLEIVRCGRHRKPVDSKTACIVTEAIGALFRGEIIGGNELRAQLNGVSPESTSVSGDETTMLPCMPVCDDA